MGWQVTNNLHHGTNKREKRREKDKYKASAVPTTTTAKIKKTEESIKLLRNHLERNTCPKPLKYSARANIPANEQFKKDIKAIKQKAERGFVEALKNVHGKLNRKGRTDSKNVNVSTTYRGS